MTYTWLLLVSALWTRGELNDIPVCRFQADKPARTQETPALYTIRVFAAGNGFGYDILVNGKAKIHQPVIPGLNGNQPFSSREDAWKIASLVIKKMQAGRSLPSVSREELVQQKIKIPKT